MLTSPSIGRAEMGSQHRIGASHLPLQRFNEECPVIFCRSLLAKTVLSLYRAVRLHPQRTKGESLRIYLDG